MFKKTLAAAAIAGFVGLMTVPTAATASPTMQVKLYSNGEPITAERPDELNNFIELRNARPFSSAKLKDLKGKTYQLNGFKGQLTLIDVWATWCAPCVRSIPHIYEMQQRYNTPGSKIRIVSVALDTDKQDILDFIKDNDIPKFETLMDPKQLLADSVPLDAIPSVFVLDGKGNWIGFIRGYVDWSNTAGVNKYLRKMVQKYVK